MLSNMHDADGLKGLPYKGSSSAFFRLMTLLRELPTGGVSAAQSEQGHRDQFAEHILNEILNYTSADAGTIYLKGGMGKSAYLRFAVVQNRSLDMEERMRLLPSIPLYDANGDERVSSLVSFSAHTKAIINIRDAYRVERLDLSDTEQFDRSLGYRTQSVLCLPLRDHDDELMGVVELLNAQDSERGEVIPFTEKVQQVAEGFSALLALLFNTYGLEKSQQNMFVRLGRQSEIDDLFDQVIQEAQKVTGAEAGTIYLMTGEGVDGRLKFQTVRNERLKLCGPVGLVGCDSECQDIPLYLDDGRKNLAHVASYAVHTKGLVNISNAYTEERFDFSGTRAFDQAFQYRSESFITIPLLNHRQEVVGVLQLINARDPVSKALKPFEPSIEPIVMAIANYAAYALNNQLLIQEHKNLLDAVVTCIAKAIDAKSTHTASHCQRVPVLTQLIAQAACDDTTVLADFSLNDDEWYELKVASWLHDCGKLSTPDFILNKKSKLYCEMDGVDRVKQRIEACRRYHQVCLLQARPKTGVQACLLVLHFAAQNHKLDEAIQAIERANIGGEFMTEADQANIRSLAEIRWFDTRGEEQPLLTQEEVDLLCIKKGTLSAEERRKVNEHIDITIDMLESLPFPKNLSRVAEIAGGHHERMDGTGFPKGLKGEEMTLQARMMAVADIFEALTSHERPYKQPMSVSTALGILKKMRDDQHIDPDIFTVFVQGGVWKAYGEQFLKPSQLDIESADHFLK